MRVYSREKLKQQDFRIMLFLQRRPLIKRAPVPFALPIPHGPW